MYPGCELLSEIADVEVIAVGSRIRDIRRLRRSYTTAALTMQDQPTQYVVCVRNESYTASLELRKIYAVIPDLVAEKHGMIRLTDESGEDYLYPRDFFLPIDVPKDVSRALAIAS